MDHQRENQRIQMTNGRRRLQMIKPPPPPQGHQQQDLQLVLDTPSLKKDHTVECKLKKKKYYKFSNGNRGHRKNFTTDLTNIFNEIRGEDEEQA